MSSGSIKAYKKIRSDRQDLNQVQDRISDVFDDISSAEIINGVLLKSVSLVTGQENLVQHKLGRKFRGYLVIAKSDNSVIWDNNSTVNMPSKYVDLRCSANVVVDLWIF